MVGNRRYKQSIAVIGDCHVGPRGASLGKYSGLVSQMVLDSVVYVLRKWSRDRKVRNIIIAGDLFDRTTISPSTIHALQEAITDYEINYMGYVSILTGNHDRSVAEQSVNYLSGVHLKHVSSTDILDFGTGVVVLAIPWIPGQTAKGLVQDALPKAIREGVNAIVGHFGLCDNKSPPWLKDDPWYVDAQWLCSFVESCGVSANRFHVLCSHNHGTGVWNSKRCTAMNIGALNPRTVDETGHIFGNIAILDCDNNLFHEKDTVPGVRFYKSLSEAHTDRSRGLSNWHIVSRWRIKDKAAGLAIDPKTVKEAYGAISLLERGSGYVISPKEGMPSVSLGTRSEAIAKYIVSRARHLHNPHRALRDALAGDISYSPIVQKPGKAFGRRK